MKVIAPRLLKEITRRLVAEFDPEKIILFGSHAWGTPDEDSDIDLLVIVSKSRQRPIRRDQRAHHCLRDLGVAVDVLVHTRAEVEYFRPVYASLTAQILEQGRVIYDRRQTRPGKSVAHQGRARRKERVQAGGRS